MGLYDAIGSKLSFEPSSPSSWFLADTLAHHMGLPDYGIIVNSDMTDILSDEEFKGAFNRLYRLRRNNEWIEVFFRVFQEARDRSLGLGEILRMLREIDSEKQRIELSYGSKMLSTIDRQKPIWDANVVRALGDFGVKGIGAPNAPDVDARYRQAMEAYSRLEWFYQGFMESDAADACVGRFDALFPAYAWISPVKKVDCLLWCYGGNLVNGEAV